MRGKRRLHKRPNVYEIERCHWWLKQEHVLVRPSGIIAPGATAARSLLGRTVSISRTRRQLLRLDDATAVCVTIHPSFLLRIKDATDKEREYRDFVQDLEYAPTHLGPWPSKRHWHPRSDRAGAGLQTLTTSNLWRVSHTSFDTPAAIEICTNLCREPN
jgi:hypothetical protein